MPKRKLITVGAKYGRWTALEKTESRTYPSGATIHFRWCLCDCGTEQWVGEYKLITGHSQSCGCLQADVTAHRNLTHGYSAGDRTQVYRVWTGILKRCLNARVPEYPRYGGRGITVCERWLRFENFLEDMGEPPPGLTIDRLDNDGPYCKENCAWRTAKEQAHNRGGQRKIIRLEFGGAALTLEEWSQKLGVSRSMLRGRYYSGWSVEEILTVPVGSKRRRS